MGQIRELVERAYVNAKEHGFHEGSDKDDVKDMLCAIALIHSELGEATEAIRKGDRTRRRFERDMAPSEPVKGWKVYDFSDEQFQRYAKDTLEDELADTVIRVFDFCGLQGIDLESHIIRKMEYNRSRPYKHGKKA